MAYAMLRYNQAIVATISPQRVSIFALSDLILVSLTPIGSTKVYSAMAAMLWPDGDLLDNVTGCPIHANLSLHAFDIPVQLIRSYGKIILPQDLKLVKLPDVFRPTMIFRPKCQLWSHTTQNENTQSFLKIKI